jgi:HEAT repeat protein
MKKNLLLVLAAICFLILSCQRGQAPEAKKEVPTQKDQAVQAQSVETKSEAQSKQQVQQSASREQTKKEKGEPPALQQSPLTEEEQKLLDQIGENVLIAPTEYFESQEDAIPYLKILLGTDHKSIRLYKGYEALSDEKRKQDYDVAMSKAIAALDPRTEEGLRLLIEALKTKKEYPRSLAVAARGAKVSQDKSVVPLLRQVLKSPASGVRLEAAGSLLALGDADNALPVLDELTKEGLTSALGFIYHGMQGTKWEQRGIESIRKALTYDNYESKALAALFLIGLTKRGLIKEDTNRLEDILIKISEAILEKKTWPTSGHGYSDHRALATIILAFQELGSKIAIPTLKRISEHPDASFLQRRADEAIKLLSN